jgi:ABC-2 type transport system ATP-binding protein
MLDLLGRIGSEFGMSVMMSSHLLGEIERVCDYLIVIEGGRLVRADSIASFTAATELLALEVDQPADALAERLRARGIEVRLDGRSLYMTLNGNGVYDAVRDEIVDLGLGLVRMEQRRHRLEDLFREPVEAVE